MFKPVTHYIRDWQHTYASNGVASAQLGRVLTVMQAEKTLKDHGIGLPTLQKYCEHYTLPSDHGKVDPNWFRKDFIKKDGVKHFSNEILIMVPLVFAFLVDVVQPLNVMGEHIECFALLSHILSLLIRTLDMDLATTRLLRDLSDRHRRLFYKLYHDLIKVKFHHAGHLPDDLRRLGKSLSCFPTERKHRDYKRIVLHVFRSVEHTVTRDYVNFVVQEFITGRFRFEPFWLDNPVDVVVEGVPFKVSDKIFTPMGPFHRDDIAVAVDGDEVVVGCVHRFFDDNGVFSCELFRFSPLNRTYTDWEVSTTRRCFVSCDLLRANVPWAKLCAGRVRLLLPTSLTLP